MKLHKILGLSVIFLLVIVSLSVHQDVSAADHIFIVTNTGDSGSGSLRRAINQANTHIGSGETISIEFALETSDPNYDSDTEVLTITP